jgi:translation initiation factor 5B
MAPKKKGNKKAQDDWEADLGETVDPIAQAEERAKEEEAAKDADEEPMGGGLLAALKKNRGKKAKKGKVVEDFVEGEDPIDGSANGDAIADVETDIAAKAPQEATFDDDVEDIYSGPAKKGKGGKGGKQPEKVEEPNDDDVEERDASGRVKTKKEKEKEKKEREKQRKKEQAGLSAYALILTSCPNHTCTGSQEENNCTDAGTESRACQSSTRSQGPRAHT